MNVYLKKNIAISDSGFIFNAATGESYSVNPIGVEILNLLKETKSTEEIQQNILSTYETDAATVEKDYYDFIKMLLKYQLAESEEE